VRLLARSGSNWTTLAQARTGNLGGFDLRFALPSGPVRALKVTFAGDRANRGVTASAGSAVGFTASVASWYYDGGNTACGFHARYGVANRTLPCGAHVTLSYGGRTVVATVDDRGPYVFGREYDLNQNVAAALGMYGVATVLASV
jgi:rare lipoprotein A (peptidoglycan hydrolase)